MRRVIVALLLATLVAAPSFVPWLIARDEAPHAARERAQARADQLASAGIDQWSERARVGRALVDGVCADGPGSATAWLARALGASVLITQQRAEAGWTPVESEAPPDAAFEVDPTFHAAAVHGIDRVATLGCVRRDVVPMRRALIGWRLSLPMLDDPADGIAAGEQGVALAGEIPDTLAAASAQRDILTFPWLGSRRGHYEVTDRPDPRLVAWVRVQPSALPFPRYAAMAAVLAALVGFVVSGGARTDRKLEAAVARVGAGDLDVTLDGRNATASAFNRMTRELRDARTRLARAERIAAWRDIARRIAHEIKNPLTPIKMSMETLRKTHARKHADFDEILEESTKTVLEETARLEHIVTEFSRFARMPRPRAESLDVAEVAEKVVSMHDLPAAHATLPEAAKGVRVELSKSETRMPSVRADREQLTQVLVNVVQNACDAAREKQGDTGGRVTVRLERADNDGVRIVVSDNGPGIPAESRTAVLEPYYTTKSYGTGLGLAIVDRIVSDHGGTVTLGDAAELGGAEVVITLRREGPADEAEASVGA